MRGYKSSAGRLARLFKHSRDAWKEKAIERQKRLRALGIKVRDLIQSRERWKAKAKALQQELEQLKRERPGAMGETTVNGPVEVLGGTTLSSEMKKSALLAPSGHRYPTYIIQLGIQQVTRALNSLLGSQKSFELFAQFFAIPSPSFNSIRTWLLRLGLYQLQREHERRSDWIMILDLTIELGPVKCLVILGIPAARLSETGFALQHQDVEVLAIEVLFHSTGEVIHQVLVDITEQVGHPLQILSDHGSDVKKGVELYQEQEHPELIYTYDVTHQMALLLKHELENDDRYHAFLQHCSLTRQRVQQTELYFLAPPKQRTKARYLNMDTHVQWAEHVLYYQEQDDFSQVSPAFLWDAKTISAAPNGLDEQTRAQLSVMEQKPYPDAQTFLSTLSQYVAPEVLEQHGTAICQAASVGRRRFQDKLGWVADYQEDVATYAQLVEIVHTVEKQVKQKGLNQDSQAIFVESIKNVPLTPRVQHFKEQVVEYLAHEGSKIPEDKTLLATSDIIESIFGKYKLFSSERPLKEIGKMVLTIPVFASRITSDLVKKAMESVRRIDVEAWSDRVFGQSMLSKRRAVFDQQKTTQKLCEKPP